MEMDNAGPAEERLVANIIAEKNNGQDSLSSSDTENEKSDLPSPVKVKLYRMFGRERPVHKVLGGGKPADLLLWRDKKVSAALLGAVTLIWALFELAGYHLLTFICHGLILFLVLSFLWSNAHSFIHKFPEHFPEFHLPEKPFLQVTSALRAELNFALAGFRTIALGRDLKKFLMMIAGLWLVSIIAKRFSFLTLVYICFVLIHTVPMLYEKYEDEIDPLAEKTMIELKKQYKVLDAKVLSKIPINQFKAK